MLGYVKDLKEKKAAFENDDDMIKLINDITTQQIEKKLKKMSKSKKYLLDCIKKLEKNSSTFYYTPKSDSDKKLLSQINKELGLQNEYAESDNNTFEDTEYFYNDSGDENDEEDEE